MILFSAKDVSKTYTNHKALDKVSIEVEQGSIFGLLGPNGAGKTTLIRIINQITAPDEGEIFFMGEKLKADHVHSIGYLPEERGLYKKMKVGEQAIYLAELKGIKRADAKKRLEFWFEKFDILSWWNRKVEELSKGMQQKVQFVTTILHEPKLLIFDEPFSGFDPINTNLLKQEIDAGRAPIFINAFESQIISLIRRTPLPALRQIDGIREGLENRLKRAARSCGSIECLLAKMKTKRYTQTHLQRLLLHLLLGMKKEDAINFAPQTKPCYLRLLGFSPSGKKLLQTIKKKACLPLVTRPARELPAIIRHSSRAARMWDLESLATDLYVLAYPCHSARKAGQDYTNPLIITK